MKKLYEKSQITFALVWIGLYVIVMNIAMQFCGGFDDLANKTVIQVLIPAVCVVFLSIAATSWIAYSGLAKSFGLCSFHGNLRSYLWFLPLFALSCINLKNGLALPAPLPVALLMTVNMAFAGYVEEIIFRGFLFRAMAKDNVRSAVIVSAVTFGAGHIVNLANTADTLGVLLQVAYAIVIGFLYTAIVYMGGSLWPAIASHMFINGTSVFAPEYGPFNRLIVNLFGQATELAVQCCSAGIIIVLSGGYALWLWKKTKL